MSSLVLQNVSLRVPATAGDDQPKRRSWILREIDLDIPLGTVFTILGPSGSGKTSLLRLLNRLHDPTEGEILFDGETLASFEPTQLRRRIGYVFQVPTMLEGSVADNLAYGANLHRSPRHAMPPQDAMLERLRQVTLDESYLNRSADRLSVGEQQRVGIARSLMTGPEVLLMDEPTSALDPTATARLLDLIVELHQEHSLTIVFVTHQLEQARKVGQQTAILVEGRIIETGPTDQVFDAPKNEATRRFLEGQLGENDTSETAEAQS
jgi:putative ABC transport system ATP-binding protein